MLVHIQYLIAIYTEMGSIEVLYSGNCCQQEFGFKTRIKAPVKRQSRNADAHLFHSRELTPILEIYKAEGFTPVSHFCMILKLKRPQTILPIYLYVATGSKAFPKAS